MESVAGLNWCNFLGIRCVKFDPLRGSKFFLQLLGNIKSIRFSDLTGLLKVLEFVDRWGENYKFSGNEDIISIRIFDRISKKMIMHKFLVKKGDTVIFILPRYYDYLNDLIEKEMYLAMDETNICKIVIGKINKVNLN